MGPAVSVLVYDSATVPPEAVKSVSSVIDYTKANPGAFAYPTPPGLTGSMAIRTFSYDQAGGVDNLLGDFDQQTYDKVAPELWKRLNDLEPALWRGGETYPQAQTEMGRSTPTARSPCS